MSSSYLNKICYLIYLGIIIVIASITAYYTAGVYILVEDYSKYENVNTLCDTRIWYYCLVSMIINIDKLFFRKYYYIKDNVKYFISVTLIEILMFVFGVIELFSNKCLQDNYNDFFYTNLWRFALGNFIMQLFIGLFLVIKVSIFLYDKSPTEVVRGDSFNDIEDINNINNHEYIEDINIDIWRNNINGIQREFIV
jgi:hypothetical protein